MNRIHIRLCSSDKWAKEVRERLLPWALRKVELGPDVLEIGPGAPRNCSSGCTRLDVVGLGPRSGAVVLHRYQDAALVVPGIDAAVRLGGS
jgi:hypothetical protein